VLTARIFRSFDIASIAPDVDKSNEHGNRFFAKVSFESNSEESQTFEELLEDFGVLKVCRKRHESKVRLKLCITNFIFRPVIS